MKAQKTVLMLILMATNLCYIKEAAGSKLIFEFIQWNIQNYQLSTTAYKTKV